MDIPLRTLELFCGENHSFSKVIQSTYKEAECISLDFNPKCQPTICEDILTWDYTQYPVGHFDIIWASPDCVNYSVLQYTCKHRKTAEQIESGLVYSDSLCQKMFEIIHYFQPCHWFVENPQGLMRTRQFMEMYQPFIHTGDYCMYSDWGYRKRTNIWTNKEVTLHTCNGECGNLFLNPLSKRKCHTSNLGFSREKNPDTTTRAQKHRIPDKFIEVLIS